MITYNIYTHPLRVLLALAMPAYYAVNASRHYHFNLAELSFLKEQHF